MKLMSIETIKPRVMKTEPSSY
jgi:hypothetical protein